MTYASIIAYVDDAPRIEERLNAVASLAGAFDAHLIGVAASEFEAPLVDGFGAGVMAGDLLTIRREQAEKEISAAETRFRAVAERAGLSHEWRAEIGYPTGLTARQARAADLIVVDREAGGENPFRAPEPGDLLMTVGRPVLIAPPEAAAAPLGGTVVVAWKDTVQAQRAALAALPLLKKAGRVIVLELSENEQAEAARARTADVAAWLKRHGVAAEGEVRAAEDRNAGRVMLDYAADVGADLLVSGAWGHARVRQWIFGGVTQTLLSQSPIWLLLSH
jgi:nucleotide-binding universal stress UspA family protein